MIKFEVLHVCKQSGARYGKLYTPHGVFETPIFMPVGTNASVKMLDSEEIKEVSDGLILANTYHLWLSPGVDVIKKHNGVHNFMSWDGGLLTDSGGFQVFSLSNSRKIKEEGVYFKNHKNGDNLFLSPEESIRIQEVLGSDIIMSFDECPRIDMDFKQLDASVKRTISWAIRGLKAKQSDQALFGIVQGGLNKDLRKFCALELIKLDFPGYAIGGLSVGEEKKEMYEIVEYLNPLLPFNKPRYLMGVGSPDDIIENVVRGVDMFDCVLASRNARHGTAFTTTGKIIIKNNKYQNDLESLDSSLITKYSRYSKSYLRHLFKTDEALGKRVVTYQNLAFLKKLMADIRNAIKEDRLLDFRKEFVNKTNYYK